MSAQKGQTVYYTTAHDNHERVGIIQEVTGIGYLINGCWYNRSEIKLNNVLLDSRSDEGQLILG